MSDLSFNLAGYMPSKRSYSPPTKRRRRVISDEVFNASTLPLGPTQVRCARHRAMSNTVTLLGRNVGVSLDADTKNEALEPFFALVGRRKCMATFDPCIGIGDPRTVQRLEELLRAPMLLPRNPKSKGIPFDDIVNNLQKVREQHTRLGLQSAGRAHHTALGVALAKSLLTKEGKIAPLSIDAVTERIFTDPNSGNPYDKQVLHVLRKLASSSKLREAIESVTAPESPHAPANRLIRSVLSLEESATIGNLEARQAALSALFTHLRQGALGSCFATSRAIQLLWNEPERVVTDFRSILSQSCIKRASDGVTETFPILMHVDDKSLNKIVTISRSGTLSCDGGSKVPLAEVRGLGRACQAMGVQDRAAVCESALDILFNSFPRQVEERQFTVKDVLLALARAAKKGDPTITSGYKALYYRGRFAYESETCNALARVWEFTLASMAESKEGGFHKRWLIDTIIKTTDGTIPAGTGDADDAPEIFQRAYRDALLQKIELRYDPNPKRLIPRHELLPTEGGFVLYERRSGISPHRWRRCDTGPAYQALVASALREAFKNVRNTPDWQRIRPHLERGLGHLKHYIRSPRFLTDSVVALDSANSAFIHPTPSWHMMTHTPWINRAGAFAQQIWRMDLELDRPVETTQIFPHDAEDLASWCLEASLNIAREHSDSPLLAPLVAEGFHALNLWVGHPALHDFYASGIDASSWIQKRFDTLARDIARSTAEPQTRDELCAFIEKHAIPPGSVGVFRAQTSDLDSELSVKEFRDQLADITVRHYPGGAHGKPTIERWLDTHLARVALPEEMRRALDAQRLIFADTNWAQNMQDRCLCLAANPGSGKVEMWLVNDDGSDPEAASQDFWLKRQWTLSTSSGVLPLPRSATHTQL